MEKTKLWGVWNKHNKTVKLYVCSDLSTLLKNITRIETMESEIEGEHRYELYREGSGSEPDYVWLNELITN